MERNSSRDAVIDVIFTDDAGTRTAVEAAALLAEQLHARLRVVIPQVVPYPLPLARPSVAVSFTEARVRELIRANGQETQVSVLLCRDAHQALTEALEPEALLVIGVRRRWWRTGERRLADWLMARGHRVIQVTGSPQGAQSTIH